MKTAIRMLARALWAVGFIGSMTVVRAAEPVGQIYNLDIPAESLDEALQTFAIVSRHKLIYSPDLVNGKTSPMVKGTYTTEGALAALLANTDLKYELTSNGLVMIRAAGADATSQTPGNDSRKEGKKDSSSAFRMAQMDQGSNPQSPEIENGAQGKADLEEIVVSAQKRLERLQDVPIPVTALNASELAQSSQTRLRDYFETVPGFVVSPSLGPGNQQVLAIRGISSGAFGNPTVGVTVDDVPFGAFTREFAPDIDPGDLTRIEVLRGPQGTLYGSNTMGGLVKYVTVDPTADRFSARAEAGTSTISGGGGLGDEFRGAVNIPLTGTVAVRISAFTHEDPGYVDNPVLGTEDVNSVRTSGGRLSALWQLADTLSLKVSALFQDTRADGLADVVVAPGLGDLQQNYIRGSGASDTKIQAYSAVLKGSVGKVDLTAVSGMNVFHIVSSNDLTALPPYGGLAQKLFHVGGANMLQNSQTSRFTQEVRATFPTGPSLDWLIGGFFSHENTPYTQNITAEDVSSGNLLGSIIDLNLPIAYTEYAAFVDPTFHLTDRFSIQFGARWSHLDADFKQVTETGASLGRVATFPGIETATNVFTYLLTPQLKISPDLMLYARVASGYRPSRSNSFNPDPSIPRASSPDKTRNYEIGLKGDVFDRVLSFDASLYYIDWKDIQVTLLDANDGLTYISNVGRAKSEGAELSLVWRPLQGLKVAGWASFDDAVLTEGFTNRATYAPEGARLPYGARFSSNLSLDQDFPITAKLDGFVGGTGSYVGPRFGTFIATPARAYYPGYTKLDFRAGLKSDAWTLSAYVTNAGNKRALLGGGAGNLPPTSFLYIQPRTVGISLAREF